MKKEFVAEHLNVVAFADTAGVCTGHDALHSYQRLVDHEPDLGEGLFVDWQARGELRPLAGGGDQRWMHLRVDAVVPLTCQRCLTPVQWPLQVDQWFRFVADEATAEAQDDESEEDLLVLSRDFDLRTLIEDELLLALPVVPRHEQCPGVVQMVAVDADFVEAEAEKPNPFAVLESLKKKP